MKRYLNVFIVIMMMLSITSLMADTWTEDFDTDGNWSGGSSTGYNAKAYTNTSAPGSLNFSTNAAVRETSDTSSGAYAWRVDDIADGYLMADMNLTVNGFSVQMARWDNSPKPNVDIEYSIDGGSNYTLIESIDGDIFTGDKVFQLYTHTFANAISPASGSTVVIRLNTTTGERMIYDDFTVDYGEGIVTPTPLSADFSADITSGTLPLTVNFTPAVVGGTSPYAYVWDFDNDGTNDSTDENPSYTYDTVGDYSVKLTVTDAALGTDAEEKIAYITVSAEPVVGDGEATDLFFSEYIEGSSDNKAIEIFNGTGSSVDLSQYSIKTYSNGATDASGTTYELSLSGTLDNNDVFIVSHASAASDITDIADETNSVCYFNGDDVVILRKNTTEIDAIGIKGSRENWAVAGTNGAAKDHTLIRKSTVSSPTTDWATSAGTNATDSQWIVNSQNDSSDLGSHTFAGVAVEPGALSVDFEADVTSGNPSLTVNFTNLVTGGTAPYIYSWDFDNDGNEDSSAANPSFTYTSVGTYTVSLYVIDTDVNDATETKTAYITISEAGSYEGYYDDITATGGETLKNQLATLISTNTNSSYNGARAQMYGYIDNINGHVTCVYTGLEVSHSYGTTSAPSGLNCEHSYPRSWLEDYDNQDEYDIAESDVHHLFPTESGVNSSRGNYSFDNVSGTPDYYYPDPPAGYTSYGGDNADGTRVFEVADQHKGNSARALLYMSVRYNLPLEPQSSDPGSSTDAIDVDMLTTLLQWHNADPVDNAEITRNDGIEDYQSNRNPFVDHPEWVSAIFGDVSVETCARPVMNPTGGTFDAVQNVTISTTTVGATIHYTTNGDTPTTASPVYTSAINVPTSMTIKAIAVKTDWNSSQVATEAYNIDIIYPVSIYDIQHVVDPDTEDASTYLGQTVNVTGIVTALDGSSFYLSAPAGGPWNSIFIYNGNQTTAIGDNVTFNAEVAEFNGLTELVNLSNFSIISSNNSVNQTIIATNQIAEEQYESSLVTFQAATVTIAADNDNQWYVSDGSGDVQLDDKFFFPTPSPNVGDVYSSITAINGGYEVNPRFTADLVLDEQSPVVSDVTHAPFNIYPSNVVTITAEVIDYDGTLVSVNLMWGTATGVYTTTTPMTPSRENYSADIPAQLEGTTVYYLVEATDNDSRVTTSSEAMFTVNAEPSGDAATDLFFSEYIEGSGSNKALEIYNGTGFPVDLSEYSIKTYSNGATDESGTTYNVTLSGTLAHNSVYVIANSSAVADITDLADIEATVTNFNGDDVVILRKNTTEIDAIGIKGSREYWDVAGTGSAAKDHTFVRKSSVASPTMNWVLSAGTNVNDSQWIVSAQNDISNLGSHTFDGAGSTPTVVATPTITPEAGEYNNEVEVTISCTTPEATIYYSIDGSAPTLAYSAPFTLTADATVKAYATKADMDDSEIAEVTYTVASIQIVEVANLTALRAGATDGTVYKVTGEVFLTYQQTYKNRKYLQDASAGIFINDEDGILAETYLINDGITNLEGTLSSSNGVLTLTPTANAGVASSNNNVVEPIVATVSEVLASLDTYESRLVKLEAVNFTSTGTFANGQNYTITDGVDNLTFRSNFYDVDYIGTAIPTTSYDLVVIAAEFNTEVQVTARNLADFTELAGPSIVATPVITPATGTYYAEQSVTIETATADATIYYTLDGNDPTTASDVYTAPIPVTVTTTVKAYAVKAGWTDSALAESIITIEELNYTPGMIISEYIEGSSSNKAIEIYNGTGADVDLTPYTIKQGNGGSAWGNSYDMTGTLAAGDVFVITNSGSDATMLAVSDANSNVCHFNGNDAVGLLFGDVLIDVVGLYQNDPGTSWDVAGGLGATAEYTLVRKNTVTVGNTDWIASAGTDATDSEWLVYPQNTFTYLGYHGIDVTATPEISPDAGSYTDEVEVTITCPTAGATIYYTIDGSDPTASSTEYTAPFTLTVDTTIKAIAIKADYENSAIATADYTIVAGEDVPVGMIISEYIEGNVGNNKALEIYNGTGVEVDLTPYIVRLGSNGGAWDNTCDMEGTLAAGAVFVIANASADQAILDIANTTSDVTFFNGDDAIGLFYNDVLIDVFGTYLTDPGTGWEVAGVTNATVDKTLVRKLTVTEGTTDWATSAGTDATTSQWVIYPSETFDMLGSHTAPLALAAPPVISPDGGDYQDAVEVSISTTTADASIYYTLDGSTPTDASTLYTAPFTLTADASVKAIAMKADHINSAVTSADFTVTQVTFEDGFTISETEMNFTSEVGVVSDEQSYTLYMQGSDLAMVEVTGDFQIQDPNGAWGSDFFFELEEEEFTVNVKFNATVAGIVNGEIIHTSDDLDEVIISLTGTATEVSLTSIYDIQYVADPATSDVSPYNGQEVIVEGIVTANNYGGKYFISSPEGGAWNAINVFDTTNTPALGDLVRFRATVAEYYEMTQLASVTNYQVISSGNPIPAPEVITTAELASMEAYESVLVTIENVEVTSAASSYGEWYVTDGSGDAQIDDNCYPLDPAAAVGDTFVSITGVVDYSYDNYGLNPRDANDILTTPLVTELDTPVITSITKVTTGIKIMWNAVDNANTYRVWAADSPDGDYGTEPFATVDELEYIYPASEGMKFFSIEASTDSMPVSK